MKTTVIARERKAAAYPNAVVSWGYLLRTGARCPGVESRRDYKTERLAEGAADRMKSAIAAASKMSVRVINGTRQARAFYNEVVSWRFQITTGARCPGILSSREYASYELAEAAGARMLKALWKDKLS